MSASTSHTSMGFHDVFINHRGEKIKKGLANFLYCVLEDRRIRTFLDMKEFPVGEDVRNLMLEAAQRAIVTVAIFTQDYGSSHWCLDELVEMMDSERNQQGRVIPIFYDVNPEDLRMQKGGRFVQHFEYHLQNCEDKQKHEEEGRIKLWKEAFKLWKEALLKASWLQGFRLDDFNGCEGDLAFAVADKIQNEIFERMADLDPVPTAVGLDVEVGKLVSLLHLDDETSVYIVLLWGMGRIGKTTLARAFYSKYRSAFEIASFVQNCGDKNASQVQDCLREDLIRDKSDVKGDMATGRRRLKHALCGKKVLIVLDDIKENFKFVRRVFDPKSLSPGSRILLTSRDTRASPHTNEFSDVFRGETYEVELMDKEKSWRLFCLHAFKRPDAPPDFEEVAKEVVEYCKGLPLALEVVGSHLCHMEKMENWEKAIVKLRNSHYDEQISDTLKISVDALDEEELQMFLDVACFFIGQDEQTVKHFWDGLADCYEDRLENLKKLGLVKVDKDHRLIMHDYFRDLGRDRSKSTRVWDDEGIKRLKRLLERGQSLDRIRGLAVSLSCPFLDARVLSKMTSLQLLWLGSTRRNSESFNSRHPQRFYDSLQRFYELFSKCNSDRVCLSKLMGSFLGSTLRDFNGTTYPRIRWLKLTGFPPPHELVKELSWQFLTVFEVEDATCERSICITKEGECFSCITRRGPTCECLRCIPKRLIPPARLDLSRYIPPLRRNVLKFDNVWTAERNFAEPFISMQEYVPECSISVSLQNGTCLHTWAWSRCDELRVKRVLDFCILRLLAAAHSVHSSGPEGLWVFALSFNLSRFRDRVWWSPSRKVWWRVIDGFLGIPLVLAFAWVCGMVAGILVLVFWHGTNPTNEVLFDPTHPSICDAR